MAAYLKKYPIGYGRLKRGWLEGFELSKDGALRTTGDGERHSLFLAAIDSHQADCPWGRLAFDAELSDDAVLVVAAFASNERQFINAGEPVLYDDFLLDPAVDRSRKERLFQAVSAPRFVGKRDLLLYGQEGRYLWLFVQVIGPAGGELSGFALYTPGDNFLATFPEIYRNNADFFHRYLSIFSSLYNDLQATVDTLDRYVDVDNCPEQFLPMFASWLGIQLDGNFLGERQLRRLVKEGCELIKTKGTRQAIERLVSIFVDEDFYMVERRLLGDGAQRGVSDSLYGVSPFGFTVMINRPADEQLHSRLMFLINQFKPIRAKVSIVFLGSMGHLDSYCFLDVNAQIVQPSPGRLDSRCMLSDMIELQ